MRTTAITLALLLAVLMVASPSAYSLTFADHLASWEALDVGVQDPVELRLEPHENYANYFFQLRPADDVGVAVGFIEVETTFGDLVCRGAVSYHLGVLSMNRQCPDLQQDRTYILSWTTDRVGNELVLNGYGPL